MPACPEEEEEININKKYIDIIHIQDTTDKRQTKQQYTTTKINRPVYIVLETDVLD